MWSSLFKDKFLLILIPFLVTVECEKLFCKTNIQVLKVLKLIKITFNVCILGNMSLLEIAKHVGKTLG